MEARRVQLAAVGSEALYQRVDRKLANLEVDLFFYSDQLWLYEWRKNHLAQNVNTNLEDDVKSVVTLKEFGTTQMFEHFISSGENFDLTVSAFLSGWTVTDPDVLFKKQDLFRIDYDLWKDSIVKFYVPIATQNFLSRLHARPARSASNISMGS